MRYLITAIYTTMLLGCTSKYSVPELPSPSLVPALYQQTVDVQYSIQVGDQLEIKSYFQPQLNQSVVVRPDGRITLVLIGEFIAANKSQTELIEELKSQYGKYMEVSGINVSVVAVAPFKVYFGGEVTKPTVQKINQTLTLLQGITQSGGFKTTANINQVLLLRKGDSKDELKVYQIDIEKVLNNEIPDIYLSKNDVIYVPRTQIADINLYVDQYINGMVPDFIRYSFGYLFLI